MTNKANVGAMSTQDDPTTPPVSKPGDPPPGPKPDKPAPTPGGQKPTGEPGQTTGNP